MKKERLKGQIATWAMMCLVIVTIVAGVFAFYNAWSVRFGHELTPVPSVIYDVALVAISIGVLLMLYPLYVTVMCTLSYWQEHKLKKELGA